MSTTINNEKRKVGRPSYILPYDEARSIIKRNNIQTYEEYLKWVHETKPYGFSTNPYQIYRHRGEWKGSMKHFLGLTDYVKPKVQEDEHIKGNLNFSKMKQIIKQILRMGWKEEESWKSSPLFFRHIYNMPTKLSIKK